MEQLVHVVDAAANKSDRWLFLFMLALVLFGGIAVVKFLLKQNAEDRAQHASDRAQHAKEREAFQDGLREIVAQQQAHLVDLSAVIEKNTGAIDRAIAAAIRLEQHRTNS